MGEPTRQHEGEIQNDANHVHVAEPDPTEYCPYCHAPLHPGVYFCLVCATPYRSIEEVITPARPREMSDGERITLKAPHVWMLFWTYCLIMLGSWVIGYCVYQEVMNPLYLILASVGFVVATGIFSARYWKSLVVQFRNLGFRWESLAGIASLAVFLPVNFGYAKFLEYLAGTDIDLKTELAKTGLESSIGLILMVCVFPAIIEEIGFRGLLQQWLQVTIRPWRAIVLTSFLFAALHVSIVHYPYLFLLSLVLGWMKWKTQSLYPCMIMHFLHNFIVLEYFW
jgi:membrane protease YdiL (CAAX protease family)